MVGESSIANGQPRRRQRAHKPAPELPVPDIEEDAAERKRVLNVLAQRRYREKKRHDRLKKEKATQLKSPPGSDTSPQQTEDDGIETLIRSDSQDESMLSTSGFEAFSVDGWDALNDPALTTAIANSPTPSDIFLPHSTNALNTSLFAAYTPNTASPSDFALPTPSSQAEDSWSFADSVLLPVHELTLLRALLRIADRIGCTTETLWSPTAVSPFLSVQVPTHLPAAWRPTLQQSTVPHHPLLDLLPWPSARDRLIGIMNLPEGMPRPPAAEGPMALANLAYDIEDNAEGVRIYGEDPCDPACWEVGQVFFERWWFLFDRQIIETSNSWRLLRGAPPLTMKGFGGQGA